MGQQPLELTERFQYIFEWLHANGPHQEKIDLFAERLGISERSLSRHLHRMKDLGLIAIETSADKEYGRHPNRYKTIVSPHTWERRAKVIIERRQRVAAAESRKRTKQRRADREAQARAEAAREAELENLTRIACALDGPDPIIVDIERSVAKDALGGEPDLVDAWLGGAL